MFPEEKKSGEGKAGKYFERKKYVFLRMRRKTEKEKEGNILRTKIFHCRGKQKQRRTRGEIIGEGKCIVYGGEKNREGKGGKYLKKKNIFFGG